MTNKIVALLLLVCLVAIQGKPVDPNKEYLTQEECYDYCYRAMFMPKPVAQAICKWRCQYPMPNCKLQFIIFCEPNSTYMHIINIWFLYHIGIQLCYMSRTKYLTKHHKWLVVDACVFFFTLSLLLIKCSIQKKIYKKCKNNNIRYLYLR
jgi:hypothetical protein